MKLIFVELHLIFVDHKIRKYQYPTTNKMFSVGVKTAKVGHTPFAQDRLEKSLDSLQDSYVVPDWLLEAVHTLGCKIVESDYRLSFESLKPCALYAIGVLISEWIFHITGTSIDTIDKVINTWSEISKHYNRLQLKKNNILALQVDNMLSTIPSSENISETKRTEINKILSEISQLRNVQRTERIEREYEEPELGSTILSPKDILSVPMYGKFKKKVDENLYQQPIPDRDENFYYWLEWSKNRWNYTRYLRKYKETDERNKIKMNYLLKEQAVKQKMIDEKKKRKLQIRKVAATNRELKKKQEKIDKFKAYNLKRKKIVTKKLARDRELLAKNALGSLPSK